MPSWKVEHVMQVCLICLCLSELAASSCCRHICELNEIRFVLWYCTHALYHSTAHSPPHSSCCRYDKQIRLLQREAKEAEEEAVMCGTATLAGGYGQMVPNPKHISSSEDRKLALKHYKNKQDMLKVSNLAVVSVRVSAPRCAVCLQ